MDESIGMMSDAYFASRSTILQWLNAILGLNYTKIEQCASGVATCQIFDALFPESVRLEKVNFKAKREYEFIQNYKVLQAAFNRVGIEKRIDVERLIKGKYQDNLEFMQWVKGFFDQHASEEALQYDGEARRREVGFVDQNPLKQSRMAPVGSRNHVAGVHPAGNLSRNVAPSQRPVLGDGPKSSSRRPLHSRAKENMMSSSSAVVKKSDYDALQAEVKELQRVVEEGDIEREFYFNKLRDIEVIFQTLEDQNPEAQLDPILARIKEILYMPEEDTLAQDGNGEIAVASANSNFANSSQESFAQENEYEE